jgi:hypothetical protein
MGNLTARHTGSHRRRFIALGAWWAILDGRDWLVRRVAAWLDWLCGTSDDGWPDLDDGDIADVFASVDPDFERDFYLRHAWFDDDVVRTPDAIFVPGQYLPVTLPEDHDQTDIISAVRVSAGREAAMVPWTPPARPLPGWVQEPLGAATVELACRDIRLMAEVRRLAS